MKIVCRTLLFGFLAAAMALGAAPETARWQRAIDEASAKGGGRVTVPAGWHETGMLVLRSNVELRLCAGAVLAGTGDAKAYGAPGLPRAFICAVGATNVAVTGAGEIFGNAWAWPKDGNPGITGMLFDGCRNVRLDGFTLRDASAWAIHLYHNDGVTMRNVRVDTQACECDDGIDIESKNVLIEYCDVDAGDDAYCLKASDPNYAVENVVVRDCIARSHCNAFKFGTGSAGIMRNVRFERCRAYASRRMYRDVAPMPTDLLNWKPVPGAPWYHCGPGFGAINVECVDGGIVEDVLFDDIWVEGFQTPIFVRGGRRRGDRNTRGNNDFNILRRITIRNVRGRADGTTPSTITGVYACRPEDVTLENVELEIPGSGRDDRPFSWPGEELAAKYPQTNMFDAYRLPAYGLFVDKASVTLKNVRFTLRPGTTDDREPVYVAGASPTTRTLSDGWTFRLDGETAARAVTVPHDWAIERGFLKAGACPGQGDLPFVGKGFYRRSFDGFAPPPGGRTYLTLDGVQCRSVVKLNGRTVGGRPFGYASETIDVTDALKPSGNVLEVEAENVELSSRWYPGSGIFRDVTVRVCPRDHVKPNTLFVRTLAATEKEATVAVSFDWTGGTSNYTFTVKDPRLWSPESPALYTLRLFGEDFRFGIRTAEFDPQKGFCLNGGHRQMRGVCMHHDLGPVGAAFDRDVARRQIVLLKEMGCDAIRTSHNPPAAALLDLCDELGVLVMDEAFDMWEVWKGDYANFWKEWHVRDLEEFVRRDRSHPCVVMWSIGNELGEFCDKTPERMIRIATELNGIVKANDATRPVTFGCWVAAPMTNGCQNTVDAFGANYMPFKYATFLKDNPKVGLVGTETASCVSSRGEYFFPVVASPITCEADLKRRRDEGREKMVRGGQMSGYDLWGPHPNDYPPDVEFEFQDRNPAVYGEFVWTGFDYLGEPDPCAQSGGRSSYFGIFDLAGFPKDRYWLYKAQWCSEEPCAHILPHWTWPGREGEVTPVHVYSSGDEAELFVNGVSQGRRKRGKYTYRFVWENVRYRPGELRVRTWRNGREWAGETVRTAGAPARLERTERRFGRLAFVTLTLVDKDGNVCPNADRTVSFSTRPGTRLVALCNGDAASREDFRGTAMKTFHGLLLAVVEGPTDGLECAK